MSKESDKVIDIKNLTRQFGRKKALDDLSVEIGPGEVFGLVGENGAGKTTLIKHILGLLIPTKGQVSVFDMDAVRQPQEVLARIGYVSEDRDLPDWMKIGQFLNFSKSFYPDWDDKLELELMDSFGLSYRQKIRSLSRGERARVCLVNALAHRPPLLLLDEPSSGLDPLVRQDVLSAIIRTVADEGRTVLFSSHLLDEVQRVADRIFMIEKGSKVFDEQIETVFEQHTTYVVQFKSEFNDLPSFAGTLDYRGGGREWSLISTCEPSTLSQQLEPVGGQIIETRRPSLDEIFVAKTKSRGNELAVENRRNGGGSAK